PLRRIFSDLQHSALGAAVGRTLSVGIAMLGLAAIGTVSISKGATANGAAVAMASAAKLASVGVPSLPAAAGSASAQKASEHNEPAAAQPPASPQTAPPPQAPEVGVTADGRIVLNTANATQLDRLPSVGPKREEQIVALRTRLGRFKSLNELLRIRGIGKKTLAKMLPLLVLDEPQGTAGSAPREPGTNRGTGVQTPTP
ncbi:MAG TPA: helix-hairpin-helix domain-containing protein, partial [Polyangiaceae bacterium]|nr:helix-hairpin-helix domain-containing protein [Polyangiaceae bacterium]